MHRRTLGRWLPVAGVLLLTACAAGVNTQLDVPSSEGLVAGFWRGLWHGLIRRAMPSRAAGAWTPLS